MANQRRRPCLRRVCVVKRLGAAMFAWMTNNIVKLTAIGSRKVTRKFKIRPSFTSIGHSIPLMRYEEISTYSTTAKTGRGSYILDVVCDDDETKQWTKFWFSNFLIFSSGLKGTDPFHICVSRRDTGKNRSQLPLACLHVATTWGEPLEDQKTEKMEVPCFSRCSMIKSGKGPNFCSL